MISAFVPILDSFVVAGTSDSQIQVMQFLSPDAEPAFSESHTSHDTQGLSLALEGITRPVTTTVLGKCSHWPVNDVAHMDESIAAASASTLSTWDLVKNHRVRHFTTPDHVTACKYIGARLLAAAGHGRLVHLYDIRVLVLSQAPVWTTKLASDNLYTMAVDEGTIFTAGADGSIYGVNLRAQNKYRWDLQPNTQIPTQGGNEYIEPIKPLEYSADSQTNAVLDLHVSKDHLFFTLESGQLCGIPRQLHTVKEFPNTVNSDGPNYGQFNNWEVQGGDFLFTADYLSSPVKTKIGCDIWDTELETHIVAGGELGYLNYYKYEKKNQNLSSIKKVKIGNSNEAVSCIRWASKGVYVSMGNTINLVPYGHVI